MMNMQARVEIEKEARKRIVALSFGDPVTNICAGTENPMRHCYFVEDKRRVARCTDKEGAFWDIGIDVIYPGHLNNAECSELFEPVWQSLYGDMPDSNKAEGRK